VQSIADGVRAGVVAGAGASGDGDGTARGVTVGGADVRRSADLVAEADGETVRAGVVRAVAAEVAVRVAGGLAVDAADVHPAAAVITRAATAAAFAMFICR
jgi:hypothetical protein